MVVGVLPRTVLVYGYINMMSLEKPLTLKGAHAGRCQL